jgi:CBS domain containing-hemolysin-like protein
MITEIAIILLLIIINGIFVMSEIALVSSRKARLQQRASEGDEGARKALELASFPNRFLSTSQIGITFISIFAGAFGGANGHFLLLLSIGGAGSKKAWHEQTRKGCFFNSISNEHGIDIALTSGPSPQHFH